MAAVAGAAQFAHDVEPEWADDFGASHAPGIEPRDGGLELRLRLLIASGGDERIWPDPVTGRSRYGTTLRPAPDETWFSSSTASTITERGYRAALADLDALFAGGVGKSVQVQDWLAGLRAELLAMYGRGNAEAVLAASGTDAELIALAIVDRLLARPVTNIVVAPNETGSGVAKAAAGRHFLATSCLGGLVPVGERLAGWTDADIEVACVDIRTAEGEPRDAAAVDLDVAGHAERALARGRGVLLHVLDTSKTGLAGPSREIAAQIAALAPERVLVLVDACQLRCPADRLRADLDCGFMVLITGSKFAGGPPLSGALLLSEGIATRLCSAPLPPEGLADYSARLDWPERAAGDLCEGHDDHRQLGARPALDGGSGGVTPPPSSPNSTLSFLGLGFPPDTPTWGRLLYDAKDYLDIAAHWALFPGAAIFLAVMAINFIGDGLRDALDARRVI